MQWPRLRHPVLLQSPVIQRHRARGQETEDLLLVVLCSVSADWELEPPRLKSLNRKVICAMSFLGSAAGPALGLSSPLPGLHLLPGLPSSVPGAPFQLQQLHLRGRKEVPGQKEDTSLDRESFQGGRLNFFPPLLCSWSRLSCEEDPPCNKFNMAKRQKVPASCFSNAEQTLKKMGREM